MSKTKEGRPCAVALGHRFVRVRAGGRLQPAACPCGRGASRGQYTGFACCSSRRADHGISG